MDQTPQLIVRRKPADDAALEKLARALCARFSLDAYSTRQSLRGFGLGLLMKGPTSKLESAAELCADHQLDSWVLRPVPPPSQPLLVRGLTRRQNGLVCHTRNGDFTLHRGDYVLVVLGDLSGSMTDKLLRIHALGGGDGAFSRGQQYQTIMRGRPLMDVFIIRTQEHEARPKLAAMLRFAPGKFNPAGLGDLAGPTTVANLDAVIRLLRHLAGAFLLDLDFGLSQLPRCQLERTRKETNQGKNVASFQRYAWNVAQVFLVGKKRAGRSRPKGADLAASVTAALAAGVGTETGEGAGAAAVLAGAAVVEGLAGAGGIDRSQTSVAADEGSPRGGTTGRRLPPPPHMVEASWFRTFMTGVRKLGWIGFPVLAAILIIWLSNVNKTMGDLFLVWGVQRGGLFFLGTGVCLTLALRITLLRRLLENTPTSKTRSAAMGFVELCGTARRAYNLVSPVGQWPCVYYRTRRYQRRTDQRGHQTWQLVDELCSGPVPFFLHDETGEVLIDPRGAKMKIRHKHESYGGGGLVQLLGAPTALDLDEKFVEESIPEMATVYVLGFAKPHRKQRPPLAKRVAQKLRQLKSDSVRMMQYDVNMDGKIDEGEWEVARRDMEKEALSDVLMDPLEEGPQVVIGQPEQTRLPFVIAEEQEPELTRSLVWKSRLWLVAAVVLFFVGVLSCLVDYT